MVCPLDRVPQSYSRYLTMYLKVDSDLLRLMGETTAGPIFRIPVRETTLRPEVARHFTLAPWVLPHDYPLLPVGIGQRQKNAIRCLVLVIA